MKISPTIQPLKVPDHVSAIATNVEGEYEVPITELTAKEIRELLEKFVVEFSENAGFGDVEVYIYN